MTRVLEAGKDRRLGTGTGGSLGRGAENPAAGHEAHLIETPAANTIQVTNIIDFCYKQKKIMKLNKFLNVCIIN